MHDYTPITELPGTQLNDEQFARIAQRYLLAAQHAHDQRVLEIACGAGAGLGMLIQNAKLAVGLDYTQNILAVAQSHYGDRLPLVGGDAQRLPFANASFDLLVNFEAIYYLRDQQMFFQEAQRILRPGGMLLLCTSNPHWPHFAPGPLTTDYPCVTKIARWLEECGFVARHYFGAFPVSAARGIKQLIAPVRKCILQSGLISPESPLGALIKRFAYGPLRPLPVELQPAHIVRDGPEMRLTPLSGDRVDSIHRVLYVLAQRAYNSEFTGLLALSSMIFAGI
ncbi:MAG: class I SAM-dependent methyltransferase [Caldilineaceae bacterium]